MWTPGPLHYTPALYYRASHVDIKSEFDINDCDSLSPAAESERLLVFDRFVYEASEWEAEECVTQYVDDEDDVLPAYFS